jgi:hypothetical protein
MGDGTKRSEHKGSTYYMIPSAKYAVIEISVNNLDGKKITKKQLLAMSAALNECCSKLETYGYISANLYLGRNSITPFEIEEIDD